MERQVLVTEANRITNPQQISASRRPSKWGVFVPEIGLSELCQKKTRFSREFHLTGTTKPIENLAEGVGFEPTVGLPQRLISSQVPLTTQPPFQSSIV